MKRYCAIERNKRFVVCTIGPCHDFKVLGDVRSFQTFDEANQCAKEIADGKYGYPKGEWINMR